MRSWVNSQSFKGHTDYNNTDAPIFEVIETDMPYWNVDTALWNGDACKFDVEIINWPCHIVLSVGEEKTDSRSMEFGDTPDHVTSVD